MAHVQPTIDFSGDGNQGFLLGQNCGTVSVSFSKAGKLILTTTSRLPNALSDGHLNMTTNV